MNFHPENSHHLELQVNDLEARLSRRDKSLDLLLTFSQKLLKSHDPQALYRICTQTAKELFDLDFSTLMLLTEDKKSLIIRDTIGFPESMTGTFTLLDGEGLSTYVVENKKSGVVFDFATESRFMVPPVVQSLGITSALCVPMMLGDDVFGVLIGHTRSLRKFSDNEINLYQSIANQAATAIQNALNISALIQKESLLRTIIETVPHPIFYKDNNGVYLGCNKAFADFIGIAKSHIIGSNVYNIVPKNLAQTHDGIDQNVLASGGIITRETQVVDTEGSTRDVIVSKAAFSNGQNPVDGLAGTIVDITACKQAEQQTLINAARLQRLFELSNYQADSAQEFLDFALQAAIDHTESTLGYIYLYNEKKELFTLNSWSKEVLQECAIIDKQRQYNLAETGIWGEAVRQRRPILINDFQAAHPLKRGYPQGHAPLHNFLTIPIFFSGTIVAVIGVANKSSGYNDSDIQQLTLMMNSVWNIAERMRSEEEKEHLNSQIQHVQKLESLGVLAGGIAHDFNNLLMAILGNTDLALMETSKVSSVYDNLQAIRTASMRAADLCRQMLAYSGKGKFVIEQINLNELVHEMTHMLQVSISKKAVLRFNHADILPAIEADATQVRQIIMNLVINASDAIGERSGVISITTGAMECDREYLAETFIDEKLPEGIYTYLEIADTGCGMDRDTIFKMFDPFFTTKFTGRGLGMAAVLGIVRGHHGGIKVYSEPSKGTTIKMLFPVSERSEHLHNTDQVTDDRWDGTGLILLVDDEETVRAVGRQMLEAIGFSVITAEDGREAVEIFKEQEEHITCVLMDLTMPHMDGVEAFRELRRLKSSIRVILSSGYNQQEVTQQFVGKGLAGFIQKPFLLNQLRNVLHSVLE